MKFFMCLVLAVCVYEAQSAAVGMSKDESAELDSIENVLKDVTEKESRRQLEDELLALKLPEATLENDVVSKKDNAPLPKEAKDPLPKEAKKDPKAESKESDVDKELRDVLQTFEDSGNVKKDQVINAIENLLKNSVTSADEPAGDAKCADVRSDCAQLVKLGYSCKTNSAMKKKCAKTCKICVTCENSLGDKKCEHLQKFGYCEKEKFAAKMKTYCFKECGYCRPSTAPECSKTKFGCCWDKVVTKQDKAGSNCKPCKDGYRYVCKTFESDCMTHRIAGDFMRKHCPETCDVCDKCFDDPKSKAKCSSWKRAGYCSKMKSTMEALCKETCDLC
eukprot:Seg1091.15 transcript_id=Seg1091.15/GoldUCD/mRNA.D3Y31 product="hypothetical protein" protein_id=Seg1091.15/GoldUCD/D3Y31